MTVLQQQHQHCVCAVYTVSIGAHRVGDPLWRMPAWMYFLVEHFYLCLKFYWLKLLDISYRYMAYMCFVFFRIKYIYCFVLSNTNSPNLLSLCVFFFYNFTRSELIKIYPPKSNAPITFLSASLFHRAMASGHSCS